MIDFHIERLSPLCAGFGLEINREITDRLNAYGNLLLEWNEKINLTAITEPEEILYKHFYDSLLFLKNAEIPQGGTVIDVGTGAGFPGVVLKTARPDIKITLLDGLNKRITFLTELCGSLGLDGVTALHSRAEEAAQSAEHREKYDVVCARAVAAMPVLLEYCLPFAKIGGAFTAMKGPSAEEELKLCAKAIPLLGGGKPNIICETLPNNDSRTFVTFKKISHTPPKYPRNPAKIRKQPL